MNLNDDYFETANDEVMHMERNKARDLKRTQWWKNKKGNCCCYYCKGYFKPLELTMDHRIPIVRGGMTDKSNVVTACKNCNTEKKDLLPFEWEKIKKDKIN